VEQPPVSSSEGQHQIPDILGAQYVRPDEGAAAPSSGADHESIQLRPKFIAFSLR
jgi:hypothetical protein